MRAQYLWMLGGVVLVGSAIVARGAPPASAGAISGKVTYSGTPPKMKPIDMAKEPTCAKEHNPPEMAQNVVTGPGNALEYVVVYISAGGPPSPTPTQAVRYDQKGCMYIPHVLPMQVDQPLQIYTGDPFAHNIRSEEHTSELQSQSNLVCRLLLEKKNRRPARHSSKVRNRFQASH